jgi:hypothetical protein
MRMTILECQKKFRRSERSLSAYKKAVELSPNHMYVMQIWQDLKENQETERKTIKLFEKLWK